MPTLEQKIILAKRCGWFYQEKRGAAAVPYKPVGVYRPDGCIATIQYHDGEWLTGPERFQRKSSRIILKILMLCTR